MISGVILSGSRSRRMGRDKAGLVLEGLKWYNKVVTPNGK